ncbi:Leucine Rich Repeat [Seminavis robusta]|uniref:Leucine Rich Repeat n=1 Tax=Seminavis robusta TaxID=568900 RepID=A0A9N8F0F3_9STRA|nr:Leucine Rich Repeat [Seminavis robusta]|eukprot:Sro2859_g338780.1 Leucine Rich Repeat (401) ;mRNA; r:2740-3942
MDDGEKMDKDRRTQDTAEAVTAPTTAETLAFWPQPSAKITHTDDGKASAKGKETKDDEHNIIDSANLKLPAMASRFSDMDSSNDIPQESPLDRNTPADSVSNNQAFIEEIVGGIEPIPVASSTVRRSANNEQWHRPGAYRDANMLPVSELDFRLVGTNGSSGNQNAMEEPASVVVPADTDTVQMPTISSDHGLVEARAITESSVLVCQEAQKVDDAVLEQQTDRQEKERHCQRVGYTIIFCSIIIIAISLGVGLRPTPEAIKNAIPTFAPTIAPTPLESFLLSLLPEQTITGIEDKDSAQYQAFKWLQEDPSVYDYPDWRILQRHALMTVFYATAGPTLWFNNTGWGNYNQHECVWFQNREFAMKTTLQALYPGLLSYFLIPQPDSQCDKQGRYQHLWLD